MQLARFIVNPSMSEPFLIVKFKENLNLNIYSRIGMQKFQYITDILVAELRPLEAKENLGNFKGNNRRNDRRIAKRNQK